MTWRDIKDVILKEFKFFDVLYFASRNLAILKMFFSGHGKKEGIIPLSKGYNMHYLDLINEIPRMAKKQTFD